MENINIFEYAAKNRLRFEQHGKLMVEDLYCLRVEDLDNLYSTLCKQQKNEQEFSLLKSRETSKADHNLLVKIAIVKHIIEEKLIAIENAKRQAERSEKRRQILDALAKREADDLAAASKEDLLKQLEELDS
jgi:hypothetical protein